jgi:uncharacterized protein
MKAFISGATSGVGEALARLLHKKGYELLLSGTKQERLEELRQELPGVSIWRADLAKQEELNALANHVRETPYDLVINNAGFGLYKDVVDQSTEVLRSMITVNCTAVVELSQAAARGALERAQSQIILNVSSVAGEFPTPGMSVYGATKAFVTSFSQAMDYEMSSKGVRVLANCPGRIATNFSTRAGKTTPHKGVSKERMSADYAAAQIWTQIQKGQSKRVYSTPYWLTSKFRCLLKPFIMSNVYKSLKKMSVK